MTHLFKNNAKSTIASWLDSNNVLIQSGDGGLFSSPESGSFQMLTLGEGDGPFEIVKCIARSGDQLTIERQCEGTNRTNLIMWPIGTSISARVTAGILTDMVQSGQTFKGSDFDPGYLDSHAITPKAESWVHGATAIGAGAVTEVQDTWIIRGLPIIPHDRNLFSMGGMGNGGLESIITSPFVDLGEPKTWLPDTNFIDGDVVQPTIPNGLQYRVVVLARSIITRAPLNFATMDSVEPVWETDIGSLTNSESGTHKFLCLKPSDGFEMSFSSLLLPSEVGFICYTQNRSQITTKPVISFSTDDSGVLESIKSPFMLTQIASNNSRAAIHRITPDSDVGFQRIFLKLETPAIGGSYVGRFFLRGLLIDQRNF